MRRWSEYLLLGGPRWYEGDEGGTGNEGEGAGSGEGDGAAGAAALDPNDPRVQTVVEQQLAGLRKNRDEVLAEKRRLQEQLAEIQQQYEGLGDPKELRTLVERLKKDEETRLIAEGKMDEVLERRTEALRRDLNARIEAAQRRATELEQVIGTKDGRIKELVIDARIRDAATRLGLRPTAIEDAIIRARSAFALDEKGNPVARDADGVIQMGKNGRDPLSPEEWLEAMKEKTPHWWPDSAGSGATGGGAGRERELDADRVERMTSREKLVAGLRGSLSR